MSRALEKLRTGDTVTVHVHPFIDNGVITRVASRYDSVAPQNAALQVRVPGPSGAGSCAAGHPHPPRGMTGEPPATNTQCRHTPKAGVPGASQYSAHDRIVDIWPKESSS